MTGFRDDQGQKVVWSMIEVIRENATYLSEIDGAIGDGDHGINMRKGFSICAERLRENPGGFTDGLKILGRVLMAEIGGSMGPLYGTFFAAMEKAGRGAEIIDKELFGRMLSAAVAAVGDLGGAKAGDKTLMDALLPAVDTYEKALQEGADFAVALAKMAEAAERGKENTRELVAKVGRSARLGERSRGVLDAGATSCSLLLGAIASSMRSLL